MLQQILLSLIENKSAREAARRPGLAKLHPSLPSSTAHPLPTCPAKKCRCCHYLKRMRRCSSPALKPKNLLNRVGHKAIHFTYPKSNRMVACQTINIHLLAYFYMLSLFNGKPCQADLASQTLPRKPCQPSAATQALPIKPCHQDAAN